MLGRSCVKEIKTYRLYSTHCKICIYLKQYTRRLKTKKKNQKRTQKSIADGFCYLRFSKLMTFQYITENIKIVETTFETKTTKKPKDEFKALNKNLVAIKQLAAYILSQSNT